MAGDDDRGATQGGPDLGRSLGKTAEGGSVKERGWVLCLALQPAVPTAAVA